MNKLPQKNNILNANKNYFRIIPIYFESENFTVFTYFVLLFFFGKL